MVQHFIVVGRPSDERRAHLRFPVRSEVKIVTAGKIVKGTALDISSSGVALLAPKQLSVGARCRIQLTLWLDRQPAYFFAEAEVISSRFTEQGIRLGLRFAAIKKDRREILDRFIRLRTRLLED